MKHEHSTRRVHPRLRRRTHQQHSDYLVGQLIIDLLPQENNALAVEAVVDVHPVRRGRPWYSVRHLENTNTRTTRFGVDRSYIISCATPVCLPACGAWLNLGNKFKHPRYL